jgi:hypothetical protein
LFAVDDTNAVPKTYTPRKNFYTLAQIARFVRPGAQQNGVSGSLGQLLQMQAFYHRGNGQLTLTGVNADDTATTLTGTLTSLPAVAKLELYYTSSDTNLYHGATVQITNGVFVASVPGDCVFTLTGFDPAKTAVSVVITNPADGASYSAPATIPIYANASTTTGSISTVAFFNGATKLGESSTAPYSIIWSNAGPGNYVLTARATNSAGNVGVAPAIHVQVVGPLAQISVTPTIVMLAPYGTQQFTATGIDALGNTMVVQPAFVWSVNGGGTIDSNGRFTAGGSVGGPFTVSASSSNLAGMAKASVTTNLNLAPGGTGYTWYNLGTSSDNTPRVGTSGINDDDLITDVPLNPDGAWDTHNAYESAGIVWSTPQTISRVLYKNGAYTTSEDGVFAADFKLQFSPDGATWNDAGPEWIVSPASSYNSPTSAGVSFTFSGGLATVTGVRCIGRVRTVEITPPPNSWVANVTEVQAFAGAAPPQPAPVLRASAETNGIAISWPGSVTNYVLETAANLNPPVGWSPLTNAPQPMGADQRVLLAPVAARQFFRLRQP